jgi:hypothetical protein
VSIDYCTEGVFKEVKCLRILRWRDQQVSSSVARLYVLEEELMKKLTSEAHNWTLLAYSSKNYTEGLNHFLYIYLLITMIK